jgi:hypothetical protein
VISIIISLIEYRKIYFFLFLLFLNEMCRFYFGIYIQFGEIYVLINKY